MSNIPLVSIFIPAYNAAAYVQQAIDSVLAQTYPNYELIIVNDASTDQTAEVINRYQAHPQVKIYHNATNLGATGNWNRGVTLCQGDFIARLDADDFYTPDYLEKVMAVYQQFPETDMVFTGVNLFYNNGKARQDLAYKQSWVRPGTTFLPELLRLCRVWSPSACVKRSCYERLGGVIEEMDIHEDWEMWVRITANGQVGYVAEPLTNIRVLTSQGCTSLAIINARSPAAFDIWLSRLAAGVLPYQLNNDQLPLLKQGMYDLAMTFAVFAMESGLTESVQKHLTFAQKMLPPGSKGSMQARLYARAAEIYFMEGGHHFKGWRFLLQSLRFGLPPRENNKHLKLWARAFFGKAVFEFVREHTVVRWKFPYIRTGWR